jgi:hypothetical protein
MDPTNETPPLGAAGLGNDAFPGGKRASELAPKPLHVQETIASLQREFIAECLRIASLKAAHAADDIQLGDDASAERSIRIAVVNLRVAATGFRQLEALTAALDALRQEGGSP